MRQCVQPLSKVDDARYGVLKLQKLLIVRRVLQQLQIEATTMFKKRNLAEVVVVVLVVVVEFSSGVCPSGSQKHH
jgi:hypothetical protein